MGRAIGIDARLVLPSTISSDDGYLSQPLTWRRRSRRERTHGIGTAIVQAPTASGDRPRPTGRGGRQPPSGGPARARIGAGTGAPSWEAFGAEAAPL